MALSPEDRIIAILQQRCGEGEGGSDNHGVHLGIGDDAAITRLSDGCELVTATDALVEGTHFLPGSAPRSLGHRCLAVNLSDLAAMGAEPRWATLSLALPQPDESWVEDFADGFATLAREHGVALIGGDTVRGPLQVGVTLLGEVPCGQSVSRKGAREGDALYVSGRPGYAGAGCALRLGELECTDPARYLHHFEFPQPRVSVGRALRNLANAMIDVSDGIATDLQRLLQSSSVGATCELPALDALAQDFGAERAAQLFLHGGEDYELLFSVSVRREAELAQLAATADCQFTRLGHVDSEPGLRWRNLPAAVRADAAFDHFAAGATAEFGEGR